MFRADSNPENWLPELQLIVFTVARALRGRRPSPNLILELAPAYAGCVSGHAVAIDWFDEDEDEGVLLQPRFKIEIDGARLNAGWWIEASELYAALQRLTIN